MSFDTSVVGQSFGPFPFEYEWKDVALYALACGATSEELDLLLETRGPKVLPTFSVVVAFEAVLNALGRLGGNMATLVHAGQKCTVHRSLPPQAELFTQSRVSALFDKGKGALAIVSTTSTDATSTVLAETEWEIFYRGEGGFGGPAAPRLPSLASPEGQEPSHSVSMATSKTQALLYRLASSDLNPIHADPDFARAVGFPGPILHGLCTFAHAARAIVGRACRQDPGRLRSIEGRFSKPVIPGQTLVTNLFSVSRTETHYSTSADGITVISHGRAVHDASD